MRPEPSEKSFRMRFAAVGRRQIIFAADKQYAISQIEPRMPARNPVVSLFSFDS